MAQQCMRAGHKRGAFERTARRACGLRRRQRRPEHKNPHFKGVAGHGIGFATWWVMANQAQRLETASTKQNRNIKPEAPKELKPRPPVKQLPPPDEDVLFFLPIG